MKCFHCHAQLTKQDVCLKCGTDVRLYKKILRTSNHFYNLGLERAKERDLTGAVQHLRQSIQLNKENIDARNLLGLVYYELGQPAFALREWILSQNFQEEDNLAGHFLKQMERSMEAINGSIRRYNQALFYLQYDSRDLALIQMKHLMTRQYQMLEARQLMALLYMQDGYFNKAQKILRQSLKIDRYNPTTKRYLNAIETRKAVGKDSSIRQAVVDAVERTENADVIIPENNKEYGSYFLFMLYIMIGLILGAGLVYYVVVPTVRRQYIEKNRESLVSYEDGMNSLRDEIVGYNAEISSLEKEILDLQEALRVSADSTQESGGYYEELMPLLRAYANNDVSAIMSEFEKLKEHPEDEAYQIIYNRLKNDYERNMGTRALYRATQYMDDGYYQDALPLFELSLELDGESARVYYNIGLAHEMLGNYEMAVYYYQCDIVFFSEDVWTVSAKTRLDQLLAVHDGLEIPEVTSAEDPGEEETERTTEGERNTQEETEDVSVEESARDETEEVSQEDHEEEM